MAGTMTLLLQVATQVVDTIYVQAAPNPQGWFQKATGVAGGIMTLTLLAMAIALVPAAWNFRKTYKKTNAIIDRIEADIMPLTKHAHSIADNLDYISTAIRSDVGMIQSTLESANRRLQGAVDGTEQRINEFNALLEVVQGEAEGLFVSTAATVRGVKTGASHLVGADGPELASVEIDDLEIVMDDEEIEEYGYDDSPESDDNADATRAPRIIRRARTRR
ncbi:MAG TPA: DUF948 domain-containing protein [Gemmatimonadaceae bacterium]|nr:DUF948 domain-containing protein [Gemmatimonadaceae bacterium]